MSRSPGNPPLRRALAPTAPALALVTVVLAYDSRLSFLPALLLGLLGVAAGVALREARHPLLRETAPIPVLVVLGVLAAETPIAPLPELLVGAVGVVFVAWLVDDPARPAGAVARGAVEWTLPAAGVGVAWASSFLLPSTAAPVGVAGGLLAAAIVVLAYLVRRPELFDREEASTI